MKIPHLPLLGRGRAPFPLVALALVACEVRTPPIEPVLDDGKADVVDRVSIDGALVPGGGVAGVFLEDLEFHAYTLDVGADAAVTLDVPHRGTASRLDATLFVFGPRRGNGGYGGTAIAVDDDDGWGDNPRLVDLALPDLGRYLVVVGSHDGDGRGRFRLTATCTSATCDPPRPLPPRGDTSSPGDPVPAA